MSQNHSGREDRRADHPIAVRSRGDARPWRAMVAFHHRLPFHGLQGDDQIVRNVSHGTSFWNLRGGRCRDSRRCAGANREDGHLENDVLCLPTGRWRETFSFNQRCNERGTTSTSYRDPATTNGSTHP